MKCHQESKEREQAEQGQHEASAGTAAGSVSTSHPALQDRKIKPQEWKNSDCTGILCSGTSKLPGTQLCSAGTLCPPCLVRGISPRCALWAGSRDKQGTSCSLPPVCRSPDSCCLLDTLTHNDPGEQPCSQDRRTLWACLLIAAAW